MPRTHLADLQNEELLSRAAPAGERTAEHEAAAHEKRNWVRLSYDCNNHCTFCLDSNAHDGTMRANLDIKIQIIEGRKRGADRLILSGGEPTMHPNFLDFVRLGKKAGYPKVQTVTNGRMFNYPAFLDSAARNGLDEITFSLHGHTAKLHDALVGTPGAFEEETAGLRAALAAGVFIVNVDIVVNKQNVRHLPEMLETFIGWGVKEFDLLQIIPFGNAWSDAREHLFYDLDGNLEHLQRAFGFARRPDVHIWLNRFPPPYAEGFEDLIQDPYKLNDEVRGRREEFDRYLSLGQKLSCREPARCARCYLQGLCDGLDEALEARRGEVVDVLRYEGAAPRAGTLPRARAVRLVAPDLPAAARLAGAAASSAGVGSGGAVPSWAEAAAGSPEPTLELELASYEGLATALEGGRVLGLRLSRCTTGSPSEAAALLAMDAGFEVAVHLGRATEGFVRGLGAPPPRLVLVQKNHDRVTDALAEDVDLPAFFATYPGARALRAIENIPLCLSGVRPRPPPRVLDLAMLGADARVDMPAYARRFVADGFYTKALRCGGCAEDAGCRGVHVNWVRAHSFAALAPVTAPYATSPAPDPPGPGAGAG